MKIKPAGNSVGFFHNFKERNTVMPKNFINTINYPTVILIPTFNPNTLTDLQTSAQNCLAEQKQEQRSSVIGDIKNIRAEQA